jgi:hypothetical protein
LFDPQSVPSITAAIDRTAMADWPSSVSIASHRRPSISPAEFAAQIVAAMDAAR